MLDKFVINILEAKHNLQRAKVKSIMASLGIVIGAASVVAITNLSEASRIQAESQFASVQPDVWVIQLPPKDDGTARHFSMQMLVDLKKGLPELVTVSQIPYTQFMSKFNGGVNSMTLANYSKESELTLGASVQRGRLLSVADEGEKTVVVGATLAASVAQSTDGNAIGQYIELAQNSYLIVGILEQKDYPAITPFDVSTSAFTLYDFASTKTLQGLDKLIVRTNGTASKKAIQIKLDKIFLDSGESYSPHILSPDSLISIMNQNSSTMQKMLSAIAGVAAVLSSASIFNLMSMVVLERRREIGVRLAIGALPADIFSQFLIEAVTVAVAAGAIGTTLGCVISLGVETIMSLPLHISMYGFVLGGTTSIATAIFGAAYPAWQASWISPSSALHG